MSEVKELFLDLLHMTGMFLSSGYNLPSEAMLDRESYIQICREHEERRAKWMIKEMQRQKLLSIEDRGDQIIISLTEKGKLEAIKKQILDGADELKDGALCLVSFDIPEHVSNSRKVLRNFLKQAGFTQIHKSLWHSRANLIEPLKALVEKLEIDEWVKIYKAYE